MRSHLGIELGTSCTEGRALINCANPSSLKKTSIFIRSNWVIFRVGSALKVTYLAGSPFGDDSVSLLDGTTILHINTSSPSRGNGSMRNNQSMHELCWLMKKGQLFSHINVYYSWLGLEDDPSTLDKFSPYTQGLNLLLLLDLATKGFFPRYSGYSLPSYPNKISSILSSQPLVNEYLF